MADQVTGDVLYTLARAACMYRQGSACHGEPTMHRWFVHSRGGSYRKHAYLVLAHNRLPTWVTG